MCGLRSNTLTGAPWREHLATRQRVDAELRNAEEPRTSAERRERERRQNLGYEIERRNAQRLIARGCRVTIATDNYQGRAPEFRKTPKPDIHEAGIGSILAIEGLVELGMSEMDAIVAATRNGAIAAGILDRSGTVEVGKQADLVLLAADPLSDISNIRKLDAVIAQGRRVNIDALPHSVLFYTGPLPAGAVRAPTVQATAQNEPSARGAATSAAAKPASSHESRGALPVRRVTRTALGKYLVELENGEVWGQLDSDDTPIALPSNTEGLTAEIKRSFVGSTTMKIKGTGRAFKVSSVSKADNSN
jgi:hypothetical protein